jgi:flagellar hook protein FlgE
MLQAMYNGVSAIQGTQQDMDVIGNNIANVDTTAYKSSTVTFADELSQTLQGASASSSTTGGTNPIQTGTGVRVASIDTVTSQGSLLSTSSPTDMAIQGNGYFVVGSSNTGLAYTRDGHFALDNTGTLVDASTGQNVLGWTASNTGAINTSTSITPASTIQIAVGNESAVQATANASFSGNLQADSATGTTFATNATVYDSLGTAQTVDLTFTAASTSAGSSTWTWSASGNPGLTAPAGTVNQGTLTFDGNGNLVSSTGSLQISPSDGAAANQNVALNFSSVSQVSGSSAVSLGSQDGYPAGSLQSFSVDQNGVITGSFSNGMNKALGQVAMAGFSNPQGLSSIGNNEYAPSPNSGTPVIGAANTGGLGSISSGYLEQSNVDLGNELSNMIVVQNAFEANTKIVTAVDQMLSTLIQMKQ